MTDYTKTTDFTSKDSLPSGDSGKIIRGAEFGTEFDNIQTAVNSKSNINNPAFTGNITVTGTVDGRDIAADGTKLDTIETSADVTDTANVTAAGAVMDSELTDITAVKALNQGVATTDSPTFAAVTSTGNVTVGGTVDGRDVAADGTKLDTVETNADVTDTTNVTAAGALMDSEVTNLAQVKAFDSADYATAAQGTTADNALPKTGGAMTGAITTNSTFDGRDVATDGTKLDGIEASADVTDTANVTAAGALMDSELTSEASVKALNQGVATTDSPTFAGVTANGTVEFDGLSGTGAVTVTDILDQDDMSSNSATALATQQSIKAYVDSQVGTVDTLAEVLANGNATGGTDVAFGDNDKAIFGAGSDLQIYHDGTHSVIEDAGTGNLILQSNGAQVSLQSSTELYLTAANNGAVTAYHNGSAKLATTSTGIDVTGTATMDGLTVNSGASDLTATFQSTDQFADLKLTDSGGSSYIRQSNGSLLLQADRDNASASSIVQVSVDGTQTARFSSGGDISFYEDTGTTAKFFWDAADETISIGSGASSTSTISAYSRTVSANLPSALRIIENTGASSYWDIGSTGGASPNLNFYVNANTTPKVTFASSGNVGIGASSPDALLEVAGTTNDALLNLTGAGTNFELRATSGNGATANSSVYRLALDYLNGTNTNGFIDFYRGAAGNDGYLAFGSTGTERMRIDSAGNVGIGTASAPSRLTVKSPDNTLATNIAQFDSLNGGAGFKFGYQRIEQIGATTPITFETGGSESMRIDSSGKIGIGTDSPEQPITVGDTSDSQNYIQIKTSATGAAGLLFSDGASTNPAGYLYDHATNSMQFKVNGSEKMRIDSSGNLLVGTTTQSGKVTINNGGSTTGLNVFQTSTATNYVPLNIHNDRVTGGNTAVMIRFQAGDNTDVGSIDSTVTATAYNTSSDQRLKDNIVDAPSASNDIDAIQVRSFDWKADGSHQKYGMVAQELQSVAPEAVSGDADSDEMMGVDYSKLVPMLVKEIQSLRARVAQLETN